MNILSGTAINSAGSKALIRITRDKKERMRHILIYNFKVYLVVAFCFAAVTAVQYDIWNANSIAGVVVLLALLVLRQADFGIHTSHGLLCIAGILWHSHDRPQTVQYWISLCRLFYQSDLHPAFDAFRLPQCNHVQPFYLCAVLSDSSGL